MRKILITGGAGYIGSMLSTELVKMNYDVTVIDDLYYSSNSLKKQNFSNIVKSNVRNKLSQDCITKIQSTNRPIINIPCTNNTVINFFGEKFATEAYDSENPGATGQAGADLNLSYYTGTGFGPLTFTLGVFSKYVPNSSGLKKSPTPIPGLTELKPFPTSPAFSKKS